MKKILLATGFISFAYAATAQFAVKGGLNFANVTNVSGINNQSRTGFVVGLFFAPKPRGGFGFRSEVNYSQQGYDFQTGTRTGSVNLNYILLPQLTTFSITKYLTLLAGVQAGILVNAKADSTGSNSYSNASYGKVIDYYNKLDYGLVGGVEINPIKSLLIGVRYNASLSKSNNDAASNSSYIPPFLPNTQNTNFKNNVVQVYAGIRF